MDLLRSGKTSFPKTKSGSKRECFGNAERRRDVRFPCAWRIRFVELGEKLPKTFHLGKCKNVSERGLKITSLQPLSRKAVVLLEADLNLFAKHIKTDHLLKISDNRILAEVRWRHLDLDTRLFEAGLEFIEEGKRKEHGLFVTLANVIL
ncbi:MAG: hypothetical protein HYS55_03955 [Candidatus Omnitrophica bacterium]|nr:hypothetical protein [Candidatus Omnitrophota bacterium]